LELESVKNNDLQYIYNKNLKNDFKVRCDNKQIVLPYFISFTPQSDEKSLEIEFYPLNEQKKSCSHLVINDSIHLYLRNLIYTLFSKIITIKDSSSTYYADKFDVTQLDKLSNPTKYTNSKFNNLFNIISATSFSKNLISFSIDLNSSKDAKIEFK
jgi:hypothetical protein